MKKYLKSLVENIKSLLFGKLNIKGTYRFRLTDVITGEVREEVVENLITLVGRNYIIKRLLNDQSPAGMRITHIALGTSTTTPAASDTQLGAEVYRNSIASSADSSNVGYLTGFFTAAETTGTYKEVGLFINATSAANSGTLFSKAAINITKASTESLTVDYQLTLN